MTENVFKNLKTVLDLKSLKTRFGIFFLSYGGQGVVRGLLNPLPIVSFIKQTYGQHSLVFELLSCNVKRFLNG